MPSYCLKYTSKFKISSWQLHLADIICTFILYLQKWQLRERAARNLQSQLKPWFV